MSEEREEYGEKVSLVGTTSGVKLQADLVQRGLQSRVRAMMKIYGMTREEAEKVLVEIHDENFQYGAPPQIPFPEEHKK